MSDVSGKTVLITGASRGIGESAAREFAAAGANVVLTARSGSAIEAIAAEIGDAALAVACDVADYAQVEAAVAAAVTKFGGVDILINNAGILEPISHMDQSDPDGWGKVIDIYVKGVYHGMRAVMPLMEKAGGGSILTISSGAAHGPVEAWSHYCASKAAANMLTRCVHKEAGDKGIR
ncbi:MAG: SDR family oxidoreductase, partial [Shimia sp.]|nr:SDR family oxidoreductase [Shimia sp.]